MSPRPSPRPARAARAARAAALASLAAGALAAGALASAAPSSPGGAPVGLAATPSVGAADTVELLVAATTDVHGRVRGWDYYAGRPDPEHSLAGAATIVDSLRRAHPGRVVLVDAGDLLQGNPFALVASRVAPRSRPHGVIAAMNAMRYDAAVVGNHEFNFGLGNLRHAVGQARFPFLAANVFRVPSGGRAFPAYTIVERAGVKIGIVGGTTPGSMVWDRDSLEGRVIVQDLLPTMANGVAQARKAGADVVVAVLHSGLDEPSSYDTASTGLPAENATARVVRLVEGIDAAVFGHSHEEVVDTTIDGVLVVQPRNWAATVGIARLTVARRGGGWAVVAKRGERVAVRGHRESPAVLAATAEVHRRTARWVNAAVGTTPVAWRADSARVADTPIADLVLEVMRRRAGADLAANAVFSVGAGFDAGPITRAEIARLYPFENTLRAVRVTGAQLRAYLEQTARYFGTYPGEAPVTPGFPGYNFDVLAGVDYTLDLSRPAGQRVTRLEARGRPVSDADTFTLALNNYRQTGGGGFAMLAGAPVTYDRGENIPDLVAEEIARRRTIRPEDYHRRNWEIVPAAAGERAWRAMQPAPVAAAASPSAGVPVRKDEPGAAATPRPRRLRVLGINDFHGAFEPRRDQAGVARGGARALAAAIARARAECQPPECVSVLLDGGDEFQGTPTSNLAYGRPVVDLFRELDVAAAALGNHEFDWGVDTLRRRLVETPYAALGVNVRTSEGASLPWLRDDTVVVRGGLRIGIVGGADPATPRTTRALNVRGFRFDSLAPAVDARVRALRAAGVDVVLVAVHVGAFCDRDGEFGPGGGGGGAQPAAPIECRGEVVDLARSLRERVDGIVSGHTHSRVAHVINGIPVVQGRSSGRGLGIIDIPLGPGADRGAPGVEMREVVADSMGPVPPRVDSIVARAIAEVAERVGRRVAEAAEAMPREPDEQYPLGNLIADAQRAAAAGDVAIMNNGGIRTGLPAGTVTFGHLYEVQPFGNTLYKLTVRGRDLRAHLVRLVARNRPRWHVSGVLLTFDSTRSGADHLVSATLADGRPIVDDQSYTVILNDFLVTGGDGLTLAESATATVNTEIVDLDALVDHLASLPQPVRAPAEVRIRAVSAGGRQ